jgi:hypothetical protein
MQFVQLSVPSLFFLIHNVSHLLSRLLRVFKHKLEESESVSRPLPHVQHRPCFRAMSNHHYANERKS